MSSFENFSEIRALARVSAELLHDSFCTLAFGTALAKNLRVMPESASREPVASASAQAIPLASTPVAGATSATTLTAGAALAAGTVGQRPIRCLITAGPTREFFDPVRFVTNPSSGKMGYAIAAAAAALGWSVDLVSGPVTLAVPQGVRCHKVVTGDDMFAATAALFPQADILIKTAAVCDFRPKARSPHKVKKDALGMVYEFEPTVDILKTLAAQKKTGQYVVGFAAETEDVERHAREKLAAKNLDCICANFVGEGGAFEADANTLHVIERSGGVTILGPAPKEQIARELVALLSLRLQSAQGSIA